ncbi:MULTISPECIES: hypothetical protein [unclassified Pseudoclavibacter]|uniref:hypothetical protein n=1 Tax=unclassified Pseudoclavibacter TaxID=2615177 RepID=UPI0011AFDDAE|nr:MULTISPECIES: hypothetical protein [unclassified Pseudoclavibacter]
MHFEQAAGHLLEVLPTVQPAMRERAEIVLRLHERTLVALPPRTLSAPYYLTGLGVRLFEDPAMYFRAYLSRSRLVEEYSIQESHSHLRAVDTQELAEHLDAFILLTGDYDTVADVVRLRYAQILASSDYHLQMYAATALAAAGDSGCLRLYDEAELSSSSSVNKIACRHRKAVALVKRFGDPGRARGILEQVLSDLDEGNESLLLTTNERRGLRSLALNALGLVSVRERSFQRAHTEVLSALQEAKLIADVAGETDGELARYVAQEHINLAQLLAGAGDHRGAVETLEQNVEFCADLAPSYLGEARGTLVGALYKSGSLKQAQLAHDRMEADVLGEDLVPV